MENEDGEPTEVNEVKRRREEKGKSRDGAEKRKMTSWKEKEERRTNGMRKMNC